MPKQARFKAPDIGVEAATQIVMDRVRIAEPLMQKLRSACDGHTFDEIMSAAFVLLWQSAIEPSSEDQGLLDAAVIGVGKVLILAEALKVVCENDLEKASQVVRS